MKDFLLGPRLIPRSDPLKSGLASRTFIVFRDWLLELVAAVGTKRLDDNCRSRLNERGRYRHDRMVSLACFFESLLRQNAGNQAPRAPAHYAAVISRGSVDDARSGIHVATPVLPDCFPCQSSLALPGGRISPTSCSGRVEWFGFPTMVRSVDRLDSLAHLSPPCGWRLPACGDAHVHTHTFCIFANQIFALTHFDH